MAVNPEMLTLARESRRFTQTELAGRVGVTQSKISKFELGALEVGKDDLAKLSKALDYPPEFFELTTPVYGLTDYFYYRKRASLLVADQKAIEANANVLRIRATRLLRGVDIESPYQFPHLDVEEFSGGAAEVARRVRTAWGMPLGPVRSVVGVIENAGGLIFECAFGTPLLDAVIQCPSGLPPLFLINSSASAAGERLRYSLSHELGHVVMRNFASPHPEDEADAFAAEFLMPERDIARDLDNISIEKALRLKPYWKVSIQALIRRARDLGKISPRKYRDLFTDLSARGFRVREPNPLPAESPSLIRDIVKSHLDEMGFDEKRLCKLMYSSESDYRVQFPFDRSNSRGFGVVG